MTDGLHAAAEDVSANEIDVEGLVASAGTFASVARKQHILDPLDVYGRVVGNLQRHEPRYPGVDRLRAVAWQGRDGVWGTPDFGTETPTLESILGAGKGSEASDAIIRIVDRPDPPLQSDFRRTFGSN